MPHKIATLPTPPLLDTQTLQPKLAKYSNLYILYKYLQYYIQDRHFSFIGLFAGFVFIHSPRHATIQSNIQISARTATTHKNSTSFTSPTSQTAQTHRHTTQLVTYTIGSSKHTHSHKKKGRIRTMRPSVNDPFCWEIDTLESVSASSPTYRKGSPSLCKSLSKSGNLHGTKIRLFTIFANIFTIKLQFFATSVSYTTTSRSGSRH